MLNALWLVCGGVLLSVTRTVKFHVPRSVDVPPMLPLLSVSPGDNCPDTIDQTYGLVPPVAARSWLYDSPTAATGNETVVIESGGASGLSSIQAFHANSTSGIGVLAVIDSVNELETVGQSTVPSS
jgi:hypothetical protein